MLLGLGRGPPGRGPPGRPPSPGAPEPGRPPIGRGPAGRGPPGPPDAAGAPGRPLAGLGAAGPAWPPPAPPAPAGPAWPGRGPRPAEPMPVDVELNGLLPGRGPGRGAPGLGPGVGTPGGPGLAPGPGAGLAWPGPACPGTGRAPGPGTGRRPGCASSRRSGACSGWLNGTCGTPDVAGRLSSAPRGDSAGGSGLAGTSGLISCCAAAAGRSATCGPAVSPWGAAAASDGAAVALPLAALPLAALPLAALPFATLRPPSDCAAALAAAASPANASLSLRTTGASIVDEADRTNSPISVSLAITALLSTPNSLASSYTRTFATTLPASARIYRASQPDRGSACSVRRQYLFIAACSSSAHYNLSLSLRQVPHHSFHSAFAAAIRPCPLCLTVPVVRPATDNWRARHQQAFLSRVALSETPGGAWPAPSSPA